MRRVLTIVLLVATGSIGDERVPPGDLDELETWLQSLEERLPSAAVAGRWRLTSGGAGGGTRVQHRWSLRTQGGETSLLAERDPGERRWNDHLVFYTQREAGDARGAGAMRIVVGDLRAGFGQGLLFGRGSGRTRGRRRDDAGRLGVRSSAESRAVRGVGVRWQADRWHVTALAGGLRWDARFDERGAVRSLPDEGLHTGPTAIAGDRALTGVVAGARLRHVEGPLALGATVQLFRFGLPLSLTSRHGPVRRIGRGHEALAVDGQWRLGRRRLYGELAGSVHGWAAIGGLAGVPLLGGRGAAQVRRYGAGRFSPLGSAAQRWDQENERGARLEWVRRRVRLWLEGSHRPEPRSVPIPDRSAEAGAEITRRWRETEVRVDGRYRLDDGFRAGQRTVQGHRRLRVRLSAGDEPRRVRLLGQHVQAVGQRGTSVGISGRWRGRRAQLQVQWTGFRIPTWDARVYEYEPTLPASGTVLPLYGTGWRLNLALDARVGPLRVGAYVRHERRRTWGASTRAGVQIEVTAGQGRFR